jgi:hypothetical protein
MSDKSTISDDYKELDPSSVTSSKVDQTSAGGTQPTNHLNDQRRFENEPSKDKISGKITGSLTEAGKEGRNVLKKTFSFGDQNDNNGFKSIMLGLFALIGFIILVYAIFVAVIGEPLASVADTVFIAALIGSFTLVGTIVSYLYKNR